MHFLIIAILGWGGAAIFGLPGVILGSRWFIFGFILGFLSLICGGLAAFLSCIVALNARMGPGGSSDPYSWVNVVFTSVTAVMVGGGPALLLGLASLYCGVKAPPLTSGRSGRQKAALNINNLSGRRR